MYLGVRPKMPTRGGPDSGSRRAGARAAAGRRRGDAVSWTPRRRSGATTRPSRRGRRACGHVARGRGRFTGGAPYADRRGRGTGDAFGGSSFLPLRDGGRHTSGPRSRLAGQRSRPDCIQLGQLSVCDAARADLAGLAEGAFWATCGLERRAHQRRDGGELHRPGGFTPLVGPSTRSRRRGRGAVGFRFWRAVTCTPARSRRSPCWA
jgi:hypothetical protein